MTKQTDHKAQAKARIESDPTLAPHAKTLLHPQLLRNGEQSNKHYRFLAEHHADQLRGLAKIIKELGLFDDVS